MNAFFDAQSAGALAGRSRYSPLAGTRLAQEYAEDCLELVPQVQSGSSGCDARNPPPRSSRDGGEKPPPPHEDEGLSLPKRTPVIFASCDTGCEQTDAICEGGAEVAFEVATDDGHHQTWSSTPET